MHDNVEPALKNPERYGERVLPTRGAPKVSLRPVICALTDLQTVRLCVEGARKVYEEHYTNNLPGSDLLDRMLAHTEACASAAVELAKAAAVCLEEVRKSDMNSNVRWAYALRVPELKDVWKVKE